MENYTVVKHKRKNNLKIDFKAEKYEKNINCPWLMRKSQSYLYKWRDDRAERKA